MLFPSTSTPSDSITLTFVKNSKEKNQNVNKRCIVHEGIRTTHDEKTKEVREEEMMDEDLLTKIYLYIRC